MSVTTADGKIEFCTQLHPWTDLRDNLLAIKYIKYWLPMICKYASNQLRIECENVRKTHGHEDL